MDGYEHSRLKERKRNMPLTAAEIVRHISEDKNIEWVAAKNLLADTMESCVDGRGDLGIVGTPGGNAGEFLLAVATLEKVTSEPFDLDHLPDFFKGYLRRFGRFYMHGDTHALEHLPNEIAAHLQPAESRARQWGNLLRNPPREIQQRLLEELLKPEHIGCGHLKLMLTRPDDYGVRSELTLAFLKTFFQSLWAGGPVEYVVLEGDHQEGAVVNVVLAGEVNGETPIPTITPQVRGQQMFVNHPQAASFLRWELAIGIDQLTPVTVEPTSFHHAIGELANRQLGHTLQALAKGLPIFEAKFFGASEAPEVVAVGVV
jgi:hypothetical protein